MKLIKSHYPRDLAKLLNIKSLKKEKENATEEKEDVSEAKANQERKATNLKDRVSKYVTVEYTIINVQRLKALNVF